MKTRIKIREKIHRNVNQIKKDYPLGTRILLTQIEDDPNFISPTVRGTVMHIDNLGAVHCHFDNDKDLGLLIGIDDFRKLTEEELAEEMNFKIDEK